MKLKVLFLLIFVQLSIFYSHAQRIKLEKLNDTLFIYTSYGKLSNGSWFPANGLVINTAQGIILIDIPWNDKLTAQLIKKLYKLTKHKVNFCIITHAHEDRMGGINILKKKGIDVFSTQLTSNQAAGKGYTLPDHIISTLPFDTLGIEVFYPGKGHTIDNIVVYLKKSNILFGGCFIKDLEHADLGFVQEAYLDEWPVSLRILSSRYPSPNIVIPGHGSKDTSKLITHTLQLLEKAKTKK
jgi:metallo-beta-lactamase class B